MSAAGQCACLPARPPAWPVAPSLLTAPRCHCMPALRACPLQNGYAWWEMVAVLGAQTALVVFNCWFLFASWRRAR